MKNDGKDGNHENDSLNKDEEPRYELKPRQFTALQALLHGETVTDAAEAAGVDRSTVHRWKKEPVFRAAFNRLRYATQKRIKDRLMHVAEHAAETALDAVQDGDAGTAIQVLKGTGMLDGTPPDVGIMQPQLIEMDNAISEQRGKRLFGSMKRRAEYDGDLERHFYDLLADLVKDVASDEKGAPSETEMMEMWAKRLVEAGVLEEDPGLGTGKGDEACEPTPRSIEPPEEKPDGEDRAA